MPAADKKRLEFISMRINYKLESKFNSEMSAVKYSWENNPSGGLRRATATTLTLQKQQTFLCWISHIIFIWSGWIHTNAYSGTQTHAATVNLCGHNTQNYIVKYHITKMSNRVNFTPDSGLCCRCHTLRWIERLCLFEFCSFQLNISVYIHIL